MVTRIGGWCHTAHGLRPTVGIAETGSGDGRADTRRPGRDFALAAAGGLLAVAGAFHAYEYPRTFNSRPPAAVLAATRSASTRVPAPVPAPTAAPAAAAPDGPSGSAPPRVALVVVDGLRDDAAAGLRLAEAHARDGAPPPLARCTLLADWPSYSIPGYAAIGTGAPPALSGVHNNWFSGPVELDSLFARAIASGRTVGSAADLSGEWKRLFPAEMRDQASGATAFARAASTLFDDRTPPRDFTLLHTVVVDDAGHDAGAASADYARAVAATGLWLRGAIARMDPGRDTLVVASDHGHIDRGGHGGTEPAALRVPLFLIGRGARRDIPPDACEGRRLTDLAPTLAVLLGTEAPRQCVGTPLRPLLSLAPAILDDADAAARVRRAAIARALGRADGDVETAVGPRPPAPWTGLLGAAVAASLGGLLVLLAGPAATERGGGWIRVCLAAVSYPAAAWLVLLLVEPGASFSAKQADSPAYGLRVFLLLSAAAAVGLGAQAAAMSRATRDAVRRTRALALAGAAASWPLVVGLHGSPFGAPLGEPHLSFAVLLAGLVTSVGCGYVSLVLAADAARGWLVARRAAESRNAAHPAPQETPPQPAAAR